MKCFLCKNSEFSQSQFLYFSSICVHSSLNVDWLWISYSFPIAVSKNMLCVAGAATKSALKVITCTVQVTTALWKLHKTCPSLIICSLFSHVSFPIRSCCTLCPYTSFLFTLLSEPTSAVSANWQANTTGPTSSVPQVQWSSLWTANGSLHILWHWLLPKVLLPFP